ncbi:MAG: HepT-like ribonuclease domain-containing protein [Chloroflexota bacterium]|jgi:uncharacterized protein with HEPN domain
MKQDRVYVAHILEMIANINELTGGGREAFLAAKHDRAAVLHYLQTMAESTQRLSDEIKAAHPDVDWKAISGFRNRLVHGYLNVNMEVVWGVIQDYVPGLKRAAEAMLEGLSKQDDEISGDR